MFEEVKSGDPVKRKPCGYACTVKEVDRERRRLKIHDAHKNRTFWLSGRRFDEEWMGYPKAGD